MQIGVGVIDHISKVYLVALFERCLVMMIDLLGNIKEQQGAWIIRFLTKNLKAAGIVSGGFILL